ncbi:class I SAM-dependent methyltransferase [Leifsonia sp. NPDC058194]|uniref:class I SAM-dependent methyltransferase n=1 Tax=Leifsonia sp. NPDC058194 TaxID=3346374 RepID=UPI0036DC2023
MSETGQEPTADEARAEVRRRFDDRAPTYDESAMHRGLADAVADFIVAGGTAAATGDILDVATGTGLVLRALRDRGARGRMIGVDLAPRMLEVARGHLPDAELFEADAASLPLADATVDLVTCVTGLQLFTDAAAAIREWARVLRPGGRVVTATFVAFDPTRHRAAPPAAMLHHEPFRSVEALDATFAPAGLRVRRTTRWTDGDDDLLIAELASGHGEAGSGEAGAGEADA